MAWRRFVPKAYVGPWINAKRLRSIHLNFGLLIGAFTIAQFAALAFPADLLSHFAVQYSAVACLFALLYATQRRWRWALAALALAILTAVAWLPLLRHAPRVETTGMYEDITVLQFNVNYGNNRLGEVVDWIDKLAVAGRKPDILVLQEGSPAVAERLPSLADRYPYRIAYPKPGAFGVLVYSTLPLVRTERRKFSDSWNEYMVAVFKTAERHLPLEVMEFHPPPPVAPQYAEQRNNELERMGQRARASSEPRRIVVGDLNITPYSPHFQRLEAESGLRNAMRGNGLAGTWPSFLPTPLRIPIDHLLVSERVDVLERTVGPNLGSDHLPVVTRLRVYQ